MNRKYIIDTGKAPRAVGPYSQAVGYNGMLYISGQVAFDTHMGKVSRAGVETQTRMVLEHISAILGAAGLDFSHVLKVTVYLRNLNDFDLMDSVYTMYCDHAAPARSVVEVTRLQDDALIMMDCVAAAPADYEAVLDDVAEPLPTPQAPIAPVTPASLEPTYDAATPPPVEVDFSGDSVATPQPPAQPLVAGMEEVSEASRVDPRGDTLAGGWANTPKLQPPKLPVPSLKKTEDA